MQFILIGFRFLLKAMYILLTEAQKDVKKNNIIWANFTFPTGPKAHINFRVFLTEGSTLSSEKTDHNTTFSLLSAAQLEPCFFRRKLENRKSSLLIVHYFKTNSSAVNPISLPPIPLFDNPIPAPKLGFLSLEIFCSALGFSLIHC